MKLNFRLLLQLLLILVIFSGSADAVTLTPIKCNASAPAPSNTSEWLNINLESFIPNASCWMNNTYHTISTFGLFNIMAKFGTIVILLFTFKAFFDGWTSRNWTGTLRVLFLSAIAVVLLNDAKNNNSITNRIYTIPVNLWRTIYKASSGMVQDSVKKNVVKNTQELATVTGAFVLHSMLATNSMVTYNLDGKQAFQQGAAAAKDGELAGLTDAAATKAMGDIKDVNTELTAQVKKMSFIFQIGYLFLMGFFMAFAGIIYFSGLTIIICMFAFPLAVAFWAVGNSRPLTTIFNTVLVSLATVAIVPVVMAVAANLAIAQPTATIKTQMATANVQAGTVVKSYIAKSATCNAQAQAAGKAAPVGSQTVVNAMTNLKCETLDQITPIAKEFGASVFRITVAMVVMIMTMMMCIGIGVAMMRHVPSLLSQIFQGGTVSADHNNVSAIAGAGVAGAIAGGQRAAGYTLAGAQGAVQGTKSLAGGLNQAGAGIAAKGADALGGGSKNPKLGDGGAPALPSPAPTPTAPSGSGGAASVDNTASNNATPAPSEQATNQATGSTTQSNTSDAPPSGGAGTEAEGTGGQRARQDAAAGNVASTDANDSGGITVTNQPGTAQAEGQDGPETTATENGEVALDTASSSGQDIGESTPTSGKTSSDAGADEGTGNGVQAAGSAEEGSAGAEDVSTTAAGDITGDVITPPGASGEPAAAATAKSPEPGETGETAAPGNAPAQEAGSEPAPMSEAVADEAQAAAAQDNTGSVTEATGETVTPVSDEGESAIGASVQGGASAGVDSSAPDAGQGLPSAAEATGAAVATAAGASALNAAGLKAAGDPGSVAAGKYTQALKDQRAQQDQAAAARMSTTATGIIGLATRDKLGLSAGQSIVGGMVAKGLKNGTQGVRDAAAAGQRLAARGEAITPKTLAVEKAAMRREGSLPSQRQADAASVKAATIAHNRAELAQAAKDPSHTPSLVTTDQARHQLAGSGQLPSQISADKARVDQVMAQHKAAQAELDPNERTPMSREEAQAQLADQGKLSAQEYQTSAEGQTTQAASPAAQTAPDEALDKTVELHTPQTSFADTEAADKDHTGGQEQEEQSRPQGTEEDQGSSEPAQDTDEPGETAGASPESGAASGGQDSQSQEADTTEQGVQQTSAPEETSVASTEQQGGEQTVPDAAPADDQVSSQDQTAPMQADMASSTESTSPTPAHQEAAGSATPPVAEAPVPDNAAGENQSAAAAPPQDERVPMPIITPSQAVPVAAAVAAQTSPRSAGAEAPQAPQKGQWATASAGAVRADNAGAAPQSRPNSNRPSKGNGAEKSSAAPAGPLRLNKAGEAAVRGERAPAPRPQVGKYTAALQAARAKEQEKRDASKPLTATRIIGMAARDNQERVSSAVARVGGQVVQTSRDRMDARADREAVRQEVQADYDRRTAAVTAQVERGVPGAESIQIVKRTETEMRQEMQRTGTLPSQVREQKAQSHKAQELTSRPTALARDHVAAARQGMDYQQLKRDGGLPSQIQGDKAAVQEVTRAHNAAETRRAASAAEKGEVYVPQTVTQAQVQDHMAFTGTLPSHQSMNDARIEQRTAQLTEQHAQAFENDPERPRPHLDRETVQRILEEEKGLAHHEYQASRTSSGATGEPARETVNQDAAPQYGNAREEVVAQAPEHREAAVESAPSVPAPATPNVSHSVPTVETVTAPAPSEERIPMPPVPNVIREAVPLSSEGFRSFAAPSQPVMHQEVRAQPHHLDVGNLQAGLAITEDTPTPPADTDDERPRGKDRTERSR